ncbi:hypothetical protein EJ06DRAFT_428786 [Trichodelitschia bisporula]|uniref:Uncharacterized protein n=1 Tax=Trichodelitschia bisporula TaxID=703511 RepID=A0A6G1HWK5_9PEZI|nr:hypothetical protein EJ06DRAFT_428786 [Trichodelitschia bisporula]
MEFSEMGTGGTALTTTPPSICLIYPNLQYGPLPSAFASRLTVKLLWMNARPKTYIQGRTPTDRPVGREARVPEPSPSVYFLCSLPVGPQPWDSPSSSQSSRPGFPDLLSGLIPDNPICPAAKMLREDLQPIIWRAIGILDPTGCRLSRLL